jgi:hypothetical protein
MVKDAFDRWWEWVEKPASSTLTIPAHFHDAVMRLSVRELLRLHLFGVRLHILGQLYAGEQIKIARRT